MPTAVITGCNSGQGYEFARVLMKDGYDVWATDMTVGEKLNSLGCKTSELNVCSVESIAAFKKSFGDGPLDVLLNIAGIMANPKNDALDTVDMALCMRMFQTNAFGPLLLTQALLPNLLKSSNPRMGVMSSRVGSIADNSTGGYYSYRASKTAVNSFCKSLAVDLKDKGVIVTIMHPGFVNTNLSPDIKNIPGVVEAEESVGKLWPLMKSKTLADSGRFWHREGQELPW